MHVLTEQEFDRFDWDLNWYRVQQMPSEDLQILLDGYVGELSKAADTADGLAEWLAGIDVAGEPECASACVIGVWLASRFFSDLGEDFVRAEVVNDVELSNRKDVRAALPDHVIDLISRFDQGAYPELQWR
jgi:hypothetical protein